MARKIIVKLMDTMAERNRWCNARQLIADGVFRPFPSGGLSTAAAEVATEPESTSSSSDGRLSDRRAARIWSRAFPVRAEHREEFRALMAWGKATRCMTNPVSSGRIRAVGKAHLETSA